MTLIRTGDTVAEFELPDQTGTIRSLTSLLTDGPVVLFFYPAAMTPGCTKEACHFRDLASEFAARGRFCLGLRMALAEATLSLGARHRPFALRFASHVVSLPAICQSSANQNITQWEAR